MSLRSNWKRFREAIQKQWDEGYQITTISFGVGKWLGTFASQTSYSAQGYETAPNLSRLAQILRERQEEGFALIDLAEGW